MTARHRRSRNLHCLLYETGVQTGPIVTGTLGHWATDTISSTSLGKQPFIHQQTIVVHSSTPQWRTAAAVRVHHMSLY